MSMTARKSLVILTAYLEENEETFLSGDKQTP